MLRGFSSGKLKDKRIYERRFSSRNLGSKSMSLVEFARKPKIVRRVSSFVGFETNSKLDEADLRLMEMVMIYVNDMNYPPALSKKIMRKFKKYLLNTAPGAEEQKSAFSEKNLEERSAVAENDRIRKGMLFHHKEDGENGAAFEGEILGAIPLKNRLDCYWFVYGKALTQCVLFRKLCMDNKEVKRSEKNTSTNSFLRKIAVNFRREHIETDEHLPLGKGAIYIIRRGHAQLLVNGVYECLLVPGSVLEVSVLQKDICNIYVEGQDSRTCPRNLINVKAVCLKQSDLQFIGCEFGVLSGEDFERFLKSSEELFDDSEKQNIDIEQIRKNLEVLRTDTQNSVFQAEFLETESESDASTKMESESRASVAHELEEACRTGSIERLEKALSAGSEFELSLDYVQSPIHICTLNENLEAIIYLCSKNCDINSKDKEGKTPLHICADMTSQRPAGLEIAKWLLNNGALIEVKDSLGNTPVHFAAARYDVVMLQLFKLHLPDLDPASLVNNSNQTPFDVGPAALLRRVLKPKAEEGAGWR